MGPRLAGFVVALTVVIARAQAGAPMPQAPPQTQIPQVLSLRPAFDRVLRDYEAAWRDGDGPRLAALFMEDGFAVQSGSPIRRGRSAIASGLTKPGGTLQLTVYAYASSGNVGYIVGGYRYPTTVGAGGRFVLALRSDPDGRWLIAVDLDNSGPSAARSAKSVGPSDRLPPSTRHDWVVLLWVSQIGASGPRPVVRGFAAKAR